MQNQRHPNFFSLFILLVLSIWLWPQRYNPDYLIFAWVIFIATALSAFQFSVWLLFTIPKVIAQLTPRRPTGLKGTAYWASLRQARRASVGRKRGYLAGLYGKVPTWLPLESSGLVLSPAGGGKTVGFVIPALMSNSTNMIVADLKGTLAAITRRHRQKNSGTRSSHLIRRAVSVIFWDPDHGSIR